MKISYAWLQSYFEKKLPAPEKVSDALTMHSFEVEDSTLIDDDCVFDVDVLPNRGHDCLCHNGIAKEIAALFAIPLKRSPLKEHLPAQKEPQGLLVTLANEELCPRYSAAIIEGVTVGPSPGWLQQRLKAIGQKPINNIVDATNYVMFDIGQPLHAFDKAKLKHKDGGVHIAVRPAQAGEKITTLDDVELDISEDQLLIVDGNTNNPIGIAGVKGGKSSHIDMTTKAIVLESANFNQANIRKTTQELGVRTDASVRFDHAISPELTLYGLRDAVALITDIAGGKFEGYIDVYTGAYTGVPTITLSVEEINKLLGSAMDGDMVEDTLQRLDFSYTRTGAIFAVTPPFERLDVRIKEDVIEEVGRIYGYEHIAPVSLPRANWSPAIHKMFYYKHRIGKLLQQQGFSEVYTYAFMNKGDIMLQNPLASDKNFLRGNLADGLEQSMQTNTHNKDLLGLYDIRIFETGKVFAPQETTRLGLAVAGTNAEIILRRAIQLLQEDLNGNEIQPLVTKAPAENYALVEIDLDALTSVLPEPTAYEASEPLREVVKYKKISPYPFVLRDIAVWVPKIVHAEDVFMAIKKEAGDLFTMGTHFDTFLKGDKASYAFRLVFQSPKKTLTDEEVNSIMDQITKSLHDHAGWEVR